MRYVIYNGHTMTNKHVHKNPERPIIKANSYHNIKQMKGSLPHLQDEAGDSICGTLIGSTEGSIPIETPQVPTVFIKSRHNDDDSSITKPKSEFESPQENGEQITVQDNKLLTTNFTVEIQN